MSNDQEILERLNDLERQVAQMVIRGVISQADPVKQLVRVTYGSSQKPMITGWLPIKPIRSGKAIVWWFPEVGEGVTVISPGDCCLGEVFPGSYHSQTPAPSDNPDLFLVEFGDGSKVSHDRASNKLDVVNVGDVEITTQQNLIINTTGDVTVNAEKKFAINSTAKNISFNGGKGVVTGDCICPLTGNPHSDFSTQVTAGK